MSDDKIQNTPTKTNNGDVVQETQPSQGDEMPMQEFRAQDFFLPIANIARIMKRALPQNAKVSKSAKECCQECVTEFVLFVTSEASDRVKQEKRKTITGEDLLWALENLGLDNYVGPLRLLLQKYRDHEKGTKSTRRRRESKDDTW